MAFADNKPPSSHPPSPILVCDTNRSEDSTPIECYSRKLPTRRLRIRHKGDGRGSPGPLVRAFAGSKLHAHTAPLFCPIRAPGPSRERLTYGTILRRYIFKNLTYGAISSTTLSQGTSENEQCLLHLRQSTSTESVRVSLYSSPSANSHLRKPLLQCIIISWSLSIH